ncbi:MAG: SPASM domain-containing protein [Planctomycetes bacterium]|nr:SPASM domain-containing protein [Planctomycetota bacterium]
MKVIGAMMVDLEQSPLGTRSRLADDLRGKAILRRTVERALRSSHLNRLHVITAPGQADGVRALLNGLSFELETHTAAPAVYQTLVRAGRIWGLDSWRGGIGSYCTFDEDFHGPVLDALARKTECDMIATIPSAAPLFDAAMLDAMIDHASSVDEPTGLTFVQAPPGLGAFLIRRHILSQMAGAAFPPGAVLSYKPASPMADMTGLDTCYRPSVAVIQARGRLLCDTERSFERVTRLIDAGAEDWDSNAIARWLSELNARGFDEIPTEIEIELTTQVPEGWNSMLRPLGSEVPRRGPVTMQTISAVADWIRGMDDVRIVLGGHGEPCLHPQFAEICRTLRDSDAAAICVRTTGLIDSEQIETAFFETPIDVVEVMFDAASAKTYSLVNGIDAYDRAINTLDRRLEKRAGESRVCPLWAPSLVKARETSEELEPFVDTWQRRLGMYVVTGHSHCAGQLASRSISSLAPPSRGPCRRVKDRAVILADGSMTTCDQDFRGMQKIGQIGDQTLSTIWRESAGLSSIRSCVVGEPPLCATCDEWHRP